jgi:DNA-binding transcriptional LysR family regulator
MLNFNQLRVFYHAAKSQSFTQAARELYITQPAVTAQMKSLESTCQFTLFRKKGRNLHLTHEGRTLFEHVCKIFEYEKEIEESIVGMHKLSVGKLRIGTTKTYARFLMPSLVSRFLREHPQVKIIVNEGSSQDVILDLLEFKNDIALITKAVVRAEVSFTPFRREELVLILSPNHPLAARGRISFEQLAEVPIIMKELGSGTRKVVDQLFQTHNRIPKIFMETGNTELIKQLVMQGEGVSFLVNIAVAQEISQKTLATVELEGHKLALDVDIAHLHDQLPSPAVQAFVDMLQKLRTLDVPGCDIATLVGKILATKVHKL